MLMIQTVKGMTDMNIKSLRNFAIGCIHDYSTFDGDRYDLIVSNLPDIIQHEFAAMIMIVEPCYASEANGPDNRHWEIKMLPSLIRYLQDSTNLDESIEFKNTWKECVSSYMRSYMQELIDDELCYYNADKLPVERREVTNGVSNHARI